MKTGSIAEFLSRRIKWLNRVSWILWASAAFCVGAAITSYTQGRGLALRSDSLSDYGAFFWSGPNPNAEYSGVRVLAEERYNTAFLWVAAGVMTVGMGFILRREKRINEQVLASFRNLNAEPCVAPKGGPARAAVDPGSHAGPPTVS